MTRSNFELYVVSTELLIRHLRPWMDDWNSRHHKPFFETPGEPAQITAKEHLAQAAGTSVNRIEQMFTPKTKSKFTTLSLADALLRCAGKEYMLSTGDIPVVPNPALSQEKWIERMREMGCVYE